MRPITILLPAYNCEDTIKEAIESCLKQSFVDFELLVINDGSIDNTEKIIRQFSDVRIVYLVNDTNKGLIFTLNRGLEYVRSKYIIRMDSDDVMHKDRLLLQYKFMEMNPNVVASGTSIKTFGKFKKQITQPLSNDDLKLMLFHNSPIFHPTAIVRKSILDQNNILYNRKYIHAEDFKFWSDISNYGLIANIPECLLFYRLSNNQVSFKNSETQNRIRNKIRLENINKELLKNNCLPFDYYNNNIERILGFYKIKPNIMFRKDVKRELLFVLLMSLSKNNTIKITEMVINFQMFVILGYKYSVIFAISRIFKIKKWKCYVLG